MFYYNKETKQFAIPFSDLRLALPNVSLPLGVAEYGDFVKYESTNPPAHDTTKFTAKETEPVQKDGKWVQSWEIVELSDEEKSKVLKANIDALKYKVVGHVQTYMDNTARERNYDNILSLCSYSLSKNARFTAEGVAGVEFRDNCWEVCYSIMEAVESGQMALPTLEEIIAQLPKINWPT